MVIRSTFSGLELTHRSKPSPNFIFHILSKTSFYLDKNYGFLRHLHVFLIPITKSSNWCSFQDHFQKDTKFLIPSYLRNFGNRAIVHNGLHTGDRISPRWQDTWLKFVPQQNYKFVLDPLPDHPLITEIARKSLNIKVPFHDSLRCIRPLKYKFLKTLERAKSNLLQALK